MARYPKHEIETLFEDEFADRILDVEAAEGDDDDLLALLAARAGNRSAAGAFDDFDF